MTNPVPSASSTSPSAATRPRLLIEEWLPIAEIGEEAARERRSMTALPPTYYLHVWWARRPLVASRAAVLASLLPANADRGMFMRVLGIHGDPIAGKKRVAEATKAGERLGADAYGYKRAFNYTPDEGERRWLRDEAAKSGFHDPIVLDPTAGGGSIPFETLRLGLNAIANDLNPVAWLVLKGTVEFPYTLGHKVRDRFLELGHEFVKRVRERLVPFYPDEPEKDCIPDGYLWARTIKCPYCAGKVPLSPNWRLNAGGKGVRMVPCGIGFQPMQEEKQHRQDADATLRIRRGAHLPHWTREGATYAVTFRLADSLPGETLDGFRREREVLSRAASAGAFLSPEEERRLDELFSQRVEEHLDRGAGSCVLADDRAAAIVEGALRHFDGQRYRLHAWAVMPNHVHAVVEPNAGHELSAILHSWKSFTANEINTALGRTGPLWQAESYDHLVRDEADYAHQVAYALNNPAMAGGRGRSGIGIEPIQDEQQHRQDADATRWMRFEIVEKAKEHSAGTVKGGDGLCPFPDCGRVIDGDEIKAQAQAGQMGQQLYAVVFNRLTPQGHVQSGKNKGKAKFKKERGFRAPRPEDDVEAKVQAELDRKMPEWLARNIVPTEEIPEGYGPNMRWGIKPYGINKWSDLFAPRQFLGHGVSVEVFHELWEEVQSGDTQHDVDAAAMTYLAVALDKMLDYNSNGLSWHAGREVLEHTFRMHNLVFKWSFAEMAPTIAGLGYDWVIEQTGKALKELIQLATGTKAATAEQHDDLFAETSSVADTAGASIEVTLGSGDELGRNDASVDAIVMDPPYYDNVMYADLSNFFLVWQRRTAGLVFPEPYYAPFADADREAVANEYRFKDKPSRKKHAQRDYQQRMAAIFRECRRVLKPHGVMTVMFTHKASGAWDALASGLVEAGFAITASWPVNTEAEGSLHIKEKSAAKSTIFLVCRPREGGIGFQPMQEGAGHRQDADATPRYWEDVEPLVAKRVRDKVAIFQEAGIGGVDLYLASFGPALEVFSENWPLTRGRPVPEPSWWVDDLFEKWDPYAVRPEDALDAARREVKRWRLEHLANLKRQHHLDPLTEWFLLAWDAFRAPRFPADEALKLARVVGLDFDAEVKNRVCEVKSSDVVLWDSKMRQAKGKLGAAAGGTMLDALHHAAAVGRDTNTGAAKKVIEDAGLLEDSTFLVALEATLNVLPPVGGTDFDALEKLRKLAFADKIAEPQQMTLFVEAVEEAGDGEDDGEES